MSYGEFVDKVRNQDTIDGVIHGSWLERSIEDQESPHTVLRVHVEIRNCRILGSVHLTSASSPLSLTVGQSVIEGDFSAKGENFAGYLEFTETVIHGSVNVDYSRRSKDQGEELTMSRTKILRSVALTGGASPGQIHCQDFAIGEDLTIRGFGAEAFDISFRAGKIEGSFLLTDIVYGKSKPWKEKLERPNRVQLRLRSIGIGGRVDFRQVHLAVLDFDDPVSREEKATTQNLMPPPTECQGRVFLEDAWITQAHLTRTVFREEVRVNRSNFSELWLDDATFHKNVTMFLTDFGTVSDQVIASRQDPPAEPPRKCRGGLSLYQTRFEGNLRLAWDRIEPSPGPWFSPFCPPIRLTGATIHKKHADDWRYAYPSQPTLRTWQDLTKVLKSSGEDKGAREADYRAQLRKTGVWDWNLWIWGFGYRPIRPLLWLGATILGCACIYSTQVSRETEVACLALDDNDELLLQKMTRRRRFGERFRIGLNFSLHAAWQWTYGWEKTRDWRWTAIALAEQATVKVLLLLLAKALANTSPLLKEITDKLLPLG